VKIFFFSLYIVTPFCAALSAILEGKSLARKIEREGARACDKERETREQSAKTQSEGEQKIRIYSAAVLSNKMVY